MNYQLWIVLYVVFTLVRIAYKMSGIIKFRCTFLNGTKDILKPKFESLIWGFTKAIAKNSERRLDWFWEQLESGRIKTVGLLGPLFLPVNLLLTVDPNVVKWILSTQFNTYIKSGPILAINPFMEFLGDGIFAIDHGPHAKDKGEGWYHQRKLAANIFTRVNFRDYFCGVFIKNGFVLIDRLSKTSGAVDIQELFFKYTMDSFGKIGFGVELNTLTEGQDTFAEHFDGAHAAILPFNARGAVVVNLIETLFPFPLSTILLKLFRARNPIMRSFDAHLNAVNEYCYKLIKDRKMQGKDVEEQRDLLSLFLAEDNKLSETFLRDIVLNFILAGRDTTACTLSWMFYRLTKHPEVQEKLIEEIEREFGQHEPDFSVSKLPYLHAVIYETLRLHPPVPVDSKVTAIDDIWPDGTKVPKNTRVIFFVWGMGRSEAIWGADCLEFKPERWIGRDPPSQFEFPVFQAGPRVCLGLNMAILEAKVVTTLLLQRFRFSAVPDQTVTYSRMLTMSIKGGYKVVVSPR
eukprot:TRINITY_DN2155_c0_g1_i1.p1 TRINITY_DN2155_c0_g1~~TRINITY_DN2155_c0_g1_i1.p1  ORF type:complete len:517 (-),score=75.92 TRINITY_DN2155_c0_g1_i1:1315-2865(-)